MGIPSLGTIKHEGPSFLESVVCRGGSGHGGSVFESGCPVSKRKCRQKRGWVMQGGRADEMSGHSPQGRAERGESVTGAQKIAIVGVF